MKTVRKTKITITTHKTLIEHTHQEIH